MTARELGANRATLLQYANSGDVPYGDKSRVVGYGAIMFWRGETAMLNADEKADERKREPLLQKGENDERLVVPLILQKAVE